VRTGLLSIDPSGWDKARRQLRRVMDDCCPRFAGLHAYYPSHRNSSRAMQLVIEAIRYKR
jgi:hypothetical protein